MPKRTESNRRVFCGKDIERLKMLYLLTVADSIATGPMAWNDWTAALLRDFFLKTLNVLEKGELATARAVEIVEQKKRAAVRSARKPGAKQRIEALLGVMSPRYLLYMPVSEIKKHIRLYNDLSTDNSEFVWQIEKAPDANTRSVTICAQDRPGLISKIAGVFTLNNIDILDVQAFTWRNNIALDIFKVNPPPDPILEDEKWPIEGDVELEYRIPEGSDAAKEVAKSIEFMRNILE